MATNDDRMSGGRQAANEFLRSGMLGPDLAQRTALGPPPREGRDTGRSVPMPPTYINGPQAPRPEPATAPPIAPVAPPAPMAAAAPRPFVPVDPPNPYTPPRKVDTRELDASFRTLQQRLQQRRDQPADAGMASKNPRQGVVPSYGDGARVSGAGGGIQRVDGAQGYNSPLFTNVRPGQQIDYSQVPAISRESALANIDRMRQANQALYDTRVQLMDGRAPGQAGAQYNIPDSSFARERELSEAMAQVVGSGPTDSQLFSILRSGGKGRTAAAKLLQDRQGQRAGIINAMYGQQADSARQGSRLDAESAMQGARLASEDYRSAAERAARLGLAGMEQAGALDLEGRRQAGALALERERGAIASASEAAKREYAAPVRDAELAKLQRDMQTPAAPRPELDAKLYEQLANNDPVQAQAYYQNAMERQAQYDRQVEALLAARADGLTDEQINAHDGLRSARAALFGHGLRFAEGGLVPDMRQVQPEVEAYRDYAMGAKAMGLPVIQFNQFRQMREGARQIAGAGQGQQPPAARAYSAMGFAEGGMIPDPAALGAPADSYAGDVSGKMVVDTDPYAPTDSIPAMIDEQVPARLDSGEFVLPADVVKFFGTDRLNKMIDQARKGAMGAA